MSPLVILLLFPIFSIHGENFVDICADSSGNECCATGMENSEYWIMQHSGTWSELDFECRLETDSQLVVFENRGENDCLIKYLEDEYRGDAQKKFAIGLKSPDEYRGVYEWGRNDNYTEFTNWANNMPTDKPCVYMTVGEGAPQNGKWTDTTCNQFMYGICERTKPYTEE